MIKSFGMTRVTRFYKAQTREPMVSWEHGLPFRVNEIDGVSKTQQVVVTLEPRPMYVGGGGQTRSVGCNKNTSVNISHQKSTKTRLD